MASFSALMSSLKGTSAAPKPVPRPPAATVTGSKIGTLFVFGVDVRADEEAVLEILSRAAEPESDALLHWRRVEGETFGIAEFRTASAAFRALKGLHGIKYASESFKCVLDKRTAVLVEQWRFLRGRELQQLANIAASGIVTAANTQPVSLAMLGNLGASAIAHLLELADSETSSQATKTRAALSEFCRLAGVRLEGAKTKTENSLEGHLSMDRLIGRERDRIQESLVKEAEGRSQLEAAKKAVMEISSQVRATEAQWEANDREIEKKEKNFVPTKSRKFGGLSMYELQVLVPQERSALFAEPIDWEYFTEGKHLHGRLGNTFLPWLSKRVKDSLGGSDRELVDYICKRVFGERVDPEELTLDLRTYVDDDADILVEDIWKLLVFETLRRRHCPLIE